MHRTESIDYAVVLSGEIVLTLDGGEEKTVGVGEFIVQAGTNHKWANRAAGPCRILFVMVAAEKIVLRDGTVLEETNFKSLPAAK
jgi:quercetin dioxygenase-like cupin family protein